MGLAASQGRYLCLTARNSDLIYEGQQISQQRLALTKETQQISEKYNEAMNNKVMQATTPEGGTQKLTYDILTSQDPFSGLCMRIVDANGNIVIPGNYIEASSTNSEGKVTKSKFSSTSDFIKKYMPDVTGDEFNTLNGKSLEELCAYYTENYPDSGVSVEFKSKNNSEIVKDGEKVLKDVNCTDPAYLQRMLTSGEWVIQQASPDEETGWNNVEWQGSSAITEVYYTADDAAAEAEYESAMTDIQKRDKILELRLEQVQTEQSSVETELDSIKEIISKNIEDSFKTFA